MTRQVFAKWASVSFVVLAAIAIPRAASANCLTPINNMTGASSIPFTLALSHPVGNPAPGWVGYGTGTLRVFNASTATTLPSVAQLFSDRFNGAQPFNVGASESIDFTISSSGVLNVTNHTAGFSWSATVSCVSGANWIAVGNSGGMEVVLTFGQRVN